MSNLRNDGLGLESRAYPPLRLHTDWLRGHRLLYNPEGYSGVTLLTGKAERVFGLCDGRHSLGEIHQRSEIALEEVFQIVSSLGGKQLLKVSPTLAQTTTPLKRERMLSVWLHLTNQCNLACPRCYIRKSRESMSWEVAKRAVLWVKETCLRHEIRKVRLKFSGGEPLLKFPLLKRIFCLARDSLEDSGIEVRFVVLTNGTLITAEVAELLAQERFLVSVSLDGVGEVQDRCRPLIGGQGSFKQVIEGINQLREYGLNPFILVVISPQNVAGLLDLTEFLTEEDLGFRFNLWRDMDGLGIPPANFVQSVTKKLTGCYNHLEVKATAGEVLPRHKFGEIDPSRSHRQTCGMGFNSVAIDHRGNWALCQVLFDQPAGQVGRGDLLRAVRQSYRTRFGKPPTKCSIEPCASCQWRYTCAGGCPALTHKIHGRLGLPSPYCEVYQVVIPRLLRLEGAKLLVRLNQQERGGENGE